MPLEIILHERHALRHHGVEDDEARAFCVPLRLPESVEYLLEIVAVSLEHCPPKRLELLPQGLQADDVLSAAVLLDHVPVHEGSEIRELVVACCHERLPDRPSLHLPVAEAAVDALAAPVHPDAEGEAHGS